MVKNADIIKLESKLRTHWRHMYPKLFILDGVHNTPFNNPVRVFVGSNKFVVDKDSFASVVGDFFSVEEFIEAWELFLEEYAG